MPKQVLQIDNFAGGLDAYSDPRDIDDKQFTRNWNAAIDTNGIIRVAGMAKDSSINTSSFDNTYFQQGHGLFQFSTDYSFSIISGDFSNGIKSGTLSAGASTSATLETTYAGTTNEFQYMQIFISGGTGIGQSRRVASSTSATPAVLNLESGENWDTAPDNTSKYVIYPWKLDTSKWFGTSVVNENIITNGFNDNGSMMGGISKADKDYYIASKKTASDNSSTNLGYIEYPANTTTSTTLGGSKALTIKPGVNYTLSFDCAAKSKWFNAVSDGDEDGSDATTIGDKVPWVQLYSATVADTKGSIKTHSATATLSAAWATNGTYKNIPAKSTTGNGKGAVFDIVISTTSSTGDTATFYIKKRGEGYVANEVLTFVDPSGLTQTGTITATAINNTGLSLARDGWLKKDDQSNYLSEVDINYIDNGDFADGVPTTSSDGTDTTAWRLIDSSSVLTLSELAGNGYDGDDGTCRIVSGGMVIDSGVPESYIYQDLTLDDLTSYDLNFLYDSSSGIKYAVYNNDTSKYILDWTTLGATKASTSSNANYSYPLDNVASNNPDTGNKSMKYITFSLDKSTTGSTASIRILFSTAFADSTTDLHGVTLYKAHHDLVSMAYNEDAACPFYNNIQFFSRYSLSFKLPINYTTVTDWKILFYGGQFGYRASNGLGAEATQQVYFDNITLMAEESDTITVLTDNRQNTSNPMFYSENSNSWINNLVNWNYQNSKANYDYINGMLKICDGNFDSGNSQAVVYYDEKRGWTSNYNLIPSPPEVFSRTYDDSELSDERFDGIEYLNTKYEGLFYDFQSFSYGQVDRQNWKLYQFGSSAHQGILLAHVHGGEMHDGNEQHIPEAGVDTSPGGFQPIALYDMDSDFYKSNYDSQNNLELTPQNGRIQDFAGVAGWTFEDEDDFRNMVEGSRVTGDGWTSKTFQLTSTHPYQGENIGFGSNASSNVEEIHSIDFNFEWELFGRWGANNSTIDGSDEGPQAPRFHITWGPILGFIALNAQKRFAGKQFIDKERGGELLLGYNQIPLSMHQLFDQEKDIYTYYGHDEDILVKYEYECSEEAIGGEIKARLKFKLSLPFTDRINVESFTNLNASIGVCVDVQEYPNRESYRRLLELEGEGNGTRRRSIKVANDATDWSLNGGVFDTTGYYDGSRLVGGTSCFERLKVDKLDIRYTTKNFIDDAISNLGPNQYSIGSKKGVQANFAFGQLDDAFGWGNRIFKLAATNVNRFGEESSFQPGVEDIGKNLEGGSDVKLGEAPSITVGMTASQLSDPYINQTKFYMRDNESDIWYLQFHIDHKKKRMYSSTSAISVSGRLLPNSNIFEWTLEKDNFKNFNEVNSYEAETMIPQEDGERNSNLIAQYKASVVANNRLYAGNIKQNETVYADRMIKSPIGKYNILPASNFIDVAINDGDEITALAYYKDKILQFKKRKVFVINISGDYEFLEDTFDNVGVVSTCSVTKTPYGIVWANKTGCYLYDGSQMANLIKNKIPPESDYSQIGYNYWLASLASVSTEGDCVVGYMQSRDSLLIKWGANDVADGGGIPDSVTYHFPTQSWMFGFKSIAGHSTVGSTGAISNMITNKDGDILYYRFRNGEVSGTSVNGIKIWNNPSLRDSTGFKTFYFTTKDFTFGNILNRKKIYKIYITYKTTDGSDSKILIHTGVNAGDVTTSTPFNASTSKFAGTSTACYHSSNGLLDTGGDWKIAEMKFTTPGNYNNIYSFQLEFVGTQTDPGFEINDISIIYKTKRVK